MQMRYKHGCENRCRLIRIPDDEHDDDDDDDDDDTGPCPRSPSGTPRSRRLGRRTGRVLSAEAPRGLAPRRPARTWRHGVATHAHASLL